MTKVQKIFPVTDKRIIESAVFAIVTIAVLIGTLALTPILAQAQSSTPAQGAAGSEFSDVGSVHPYGITIDSMKAKGFVSGNPDGTFAPDKSINRAELVTMVIASITKTPTGSNCFTDVHNEWFAPRVCEAKKRGLVAGYADGSFRPFNNVNFVEAAQIIAKAQKVAMGPAMGGDGWFQPAVTALADIKAIPTTVDTVDEKLSRAETAELILRVVEPNSTRASKTLANLTDTLPTLNSCTELSDKITMVRYKNYRENQIQARMYKSMNVGAVMEDESVAEESAPPAAAPQATTAIASDSAAAGGAAADFSTTNVQVAGVDEADVIKNDGEFIYMVSGSTVRIVKAYQPTDLAQVAKLTLSDKNFSPTEIYNYGKKLVVIGSTHSNYPDDGQPVPMMEKRMMIYPPMYGVSRSKVFVIDMSDKANLREERSVEFDGYQVSSRRINNYVYLVVNKSPDYRIMYSEAGTPASAADATSLIPTYKDSRIGKDMPVVPCASIHFMPDYQEMNMMTIAAINLDNSAAPVRKEVVMGSGDTVYASTNNLYVAATRYNYPTAVLFDTFAPATESQEKTQIVQFKLNNGDIAVGTKGEVPGHLLNQFSMDEDGSDFRIATTVGAVWGGFRGEETQKSYNNVYVLNSSSLSERRGQIEHLAAGETIYSVRFLGERAYMVTFKKIDPFFVIDLADGANPKVLGELKIPGYSDYLHPIDENHVLGFGKDAVDPQEIEDGMVSWWSNRLDFAWYQGMKVAVFDVTDVKNPKLQSNLVIGDRGTDSELLHNHKALFFDKARGLIAFPVTVHEVKNKAEGSYTGSEYGKPTFQGAYVLKLDSSNNLSVAGKISHLPAGTWDVPENSNSWWYPDQKQELLIQRILSMGNYLYTVSLGRIRASNIADLSEVKSIDLEVDKQQGGWGWAE